jgi:hypothetical protein
VWQLLWLPEAFWLAGCGSTDGQMAGLAISTGHCANSQGLPNVQLWMDCVWQHGWLAAWTLCGCEGGWLVEELCVVARMAAN